MKSGENGEKEGKYGVKWERRESKGVKEREAKRGSGWEEKGEIRK